MRDPKTHAKVLALRQVTVGDALEAALTPKENEA